MKWIKKFSKFKINDFVSIFLILFAFPFAILKRRTEKDLWIISERPDDARDNGYHLYKYIRENYPDKKVYYAINTKSKDFLKIVNYDNYLEFGSFKHYIYYLAANKNISSQIGTGEPNGRVCLNLEILGIIKNQKVFLQHGITKDYINFAKYENCKIRIFVCGAKPEYDFVNKEFGYPTGYVNYLGLCRFDNLHNFDFEISQKKILIMPTWRQWLDEDDLKFLDSDYYKRYTELINSDILHRFLENNKMQVIFYLHDNMQKFSTYFKSSCKSIIIANKNDYDIQDIIKESILLISDYSSVFFDFAYMRKPTLYYHFDIAQYRKGHYKEGYFNYERDSFGPITYDLNGLMEKLEEFSINDFKMSVNDMKKVEEFFPLFDNENCKRNYDLIEAL